MIIGFEPDLRIEFIILFDFMDRWELYIETFRHKTFFHDVCIRDEKSIQQVKQQIHNRKSPQ